MLEVTTKHKQAAKMAMISASALKERMNKHKATGGSGGKSGNRYNMKTAFELEEEEARLAAVEAELDEIVRKERERWLRIKRMFTPPNIIGMIRHALRDKLALALRKYQDKKGTLDTLFNDLEIVTKEQKWAWVHWWKDIDNLGHNSVRYERFTAYFRLIQDVWSRRLFEVVNVSASGSITLIDWLTFAKSYLLVDRDKTEEFSFRMMSRRGVVFRPAISIIDLEDMRIFLKQRYSQFAGEAFAKILYKNALAVFEYVDSDGDGGLYIDEFQKFTLKNPVFVRFTHCWQNHLRKVCFGIKYWVERTRIVKKNRATGIGQRLTTLKNINLDSEKFTSIELKDPVIDLAGKPMKTQAHVEYQNTDLAVKTLDAAENQDFQDAAREIFESAISDDDPVMAELKKAQAANMDENGRIVNKELAKKHKKAIQGLAATPGNKKKNYTLDASGNMVEVDDQGKVVKKGYDDQRKYVEFRGPFLRTAAATRKFEQDFAEVHAEMLKKQYLKQQRKKENNDASKYIAGRTYKKLVRICEDLIYARKWLRLAFNHWTDIFEISREKKVLTPAEEAEAARIVGKKLMTRMLGKSMDLERLKVGDLSPAMRAEIGRIEERERVERHKKMTKEEILREEQVERERKESEEAYALHDQIVVNCKNEDDHYDDGDHQQALWDIEYRARLQEPIASGRYFRHEHLTRKRDALLASTPAVFSPNSRANSRPASNMYQRPRTGEYIKDLPGGGGPGRLGRILTSRERRPGTGDRPRSGGQPGAGGRPRAGPDHTRPRSSERAQSPAARPATRELAEIEAGRSRPGTASWVEFFSEPEIIPFPDESVDYFERDKFFTNEVGESFFFPSLNPPDALSSQRNSSPRKHYVFEDAKAKDRGYNSDSSEDV